MYLSCCHPSKCGRPFIDSINPTGGSIEAEARRSLETLCLPQRTSTTRNGIAIFALVLTLTPPSRAAGTTLAVSPLHLATPSFVGLNEVSQKREIDKDGPMGQVKAMVAPLPLFRAFVIAEPSLGRTSVSCERKANRCC